MADRLLDPLLTLADGFAQSLTDRLDRIFGIDVEFRALVLEGRNGGRVAVGVWEDDEFQHVPLRINGKHRLLLLVKYHCCWDTGQDFLAIEKSWIQVRMNDMRDAPLFRYEFIRRPQTGVPGAHIQIHAHRDEITFLLMHSDKGRPRALARKNDVPRLAKFHFPVGGPRFRPCVEDVAEALIEEFGVETKDDDWRSVINEGREEWRRYQVKSVVRDTPEDAAEVLEQLGYGVTRPPGGPPRDALDKLRVY